MSDAVERQISRRGFLSKMGHGIAAAKVAAVHDVDDQPIPVLSAVDPATQSTAPKTIMEMARQASQERAHA